MPRRLLLPIILTLAAGCAEGTKPKESLIPSVAPKAPELPRPMQGDQEPGTQ